jgi:hypothetical protein
MAILDASNDGKGIVIPDDPLAQHPELDRHQLLECRKFLDQLLADEATPNADLKGFLNRIAGPVWGGPFGFGADAKSARRYLEALRSAITRKLA